ncbi:MAG: tetratricopeptide repeat protein, partial [Armatimonadetes bacterium]|nr:tetratricopeptide repeat protein [Armatimonadota bacterium]
MDLPSGNREDDMSGVERNGNSQLWITVIVAVSAGLLLLMALGAAFFGVYVWPSISKELFPVQFTEHEGFFPYGFGVREQPLPAAVPPKATLAIAPFANQSAEEDYEWLGYAFAYGTVSRLANFNELVIAGPEEIREELANEQSELTLSGITSSAAAREAGEAVYADYVLIANCAKSGDEIRATAQIVEVATGNIHSERAGVREYGKIFDFHAELARWVAEALDITVDSAGLERIKYKPTKSIPAYECFGQGVMHYYRGEYEEAAAACQKALDMDSDLADAYIVLARALVGQEEYGEAITQLKKAEKLDADRAYLHYYLGIAYRQNEDYDKAVDELRQAVERYPSDARIRRWLGSGYHRRYQYERALIYYKEAIRLRPNWALAHCNIAGAYEHLGREDEEMAEYRETLRLSK